MQAIGKMSHIERKGIFLWLQNLMDGKREKFTPSSELKSDVQ
jgi:hypothetical protein